MIAPVLPAGVREILRDARYRAGQNRDISTMNAAEALDLHASNMTAEFTAFVVAFRTTMEEASGDYATTHDSDAYRATIRAAADTLPRTVSLSWAGFREAVRPCQAIYGTVPVERFLAKFHPTALPLV
jgi:hypothetical protein